MSLHSAFIQWELGDGDFEDGKYSRAHKWTFDGGVVIEASPSPGIVPVPYSNPDFVDPEEAFVAAISSCHMLWFLSIAAKHALAVSSYEDHAVGTMSANEAGQYWISRIDLHPQVVFDTANNPSPEMVSWLHHSAHENCFLANSVKTEINVV